MPRSSYSYEPVAEAAENLELMRLMDGLHLKYPFYSSRQMRDTLRRLDYGANRKRIQRLMRLMGIEAMYPKPRTSIPNAEHRVYPYVRGEIEVSRPDHVWCAHITYVPMPLGFLSLVAVMDSFRRCVLAWELSNSLDAEFCVTALSHALQRHDAPEIFNTDRGCQCTSEAFRSPLLENKIHISMDGRARYLDNIAIERLWRTVKYEEIHLKGYSDGRDARSSLSRYFLFYNAEQPHSTFNGRTPQEVYAGLR